MTYLVAGISVPVLIMLKKVWRCENQNFLDSSVNAGTIEKATETVTAPKKNC